MADDNTSQPYVEKVHMYDILKNLYNDVTSYATNLTRWILTNSNLVEQLKLEITQNKVIQYLLRNNYAVSQKLSQEIRTQINGNPLTRQGGMQISQAQKKKSMISSGITRLAVIKLMWDTTAGRAAMLVITRIIKKQWRRVTWWEDARGTNTGSRTNDGVG